MFSNLGIALIDFVQIAAGFLLVMVLVFGDKSPRRFLTNFMHVVFAFQCLLIIIFRDRLTPKLFAGLMLFSTLIIRFILARRTHEVSKSLTTSQQPLDLQRAQEAANRDEVHSMRKFIARDGNNYRWRRINTGVLPERRAGS